VLYDQISIISSDRARIKAITQDEFIKTKSAILKLINDFRLFQFLKENPAYQDAKYVDFNAARNETAYRPMAEVDTRTRTLKLPLSRGQIHSQGRFNLESVAINISHSGGGVRSNLSKDFAPENMLDADPETFWGEVVLTDGRPQHNFRLSHSASPRQFGSGYQKGIDYESNGIIFTVDLVFQKTVIVNNIRIYPIADFPLRVIDIAYKTSDADTEWKPLSGFNPASYDSTLDWIEWNGKRTSLAAIRVAVEQENYTINIYHVPSDLLFNNQLWEQIVDKTHRESLHEIELTTALSNKIAAEPELLAYINELSDISRELRSVVVEPGQINEYPLIERVASMTAGHLTKTIPDESLDFINTVDGIPLRSIAPLIEIRKNQFVCGIRSFEANDLSYEAFGYYESPKFQSNASILEVSLETKEKHRLLDDSLGFGRFQRTSIEYELQVSDEIAFQIAPINNRVSLQDADGIDIKDELLIINRTERRAISRFPYVNQTTSAPSVQIRKNGVRLSPTVPNSASANVPIKLNYEANFITIDKYRYIQVVFTEFSYNPRAVYTISYMAHMDSAVIDINGRLDSRPVTPPEEFSSTDRNNRVALNYWPYIEYTIVNDTGAWRQEDDSLARWRFAPGDFNYARGTVGIAGTGNMNVVTGTNTFWINHGVRTLVTGDLIGITGASIKFIGDNHVYPIAQISNNSGLTVFSAIDTGFLLDNNKPVDLKYVIGKTTTIDDITWGLDSVTYEPLEIFVNDVKAINRTNYNTLEHQAFVPQSTNTRIFEYIQAGKYIYFNAPTNGKIEISYRYLTKFIKLNALLRCHRVVNPTDTPILDAYTIMIKNSRI